MSQAIFDQVLEAIRAFSPEERERLRALLDDWQEEPEHTWTEEEFEEEMEQKGILTRPKGPRPDPEHYRQRKPITVKGKPISETIIEERR